jgi:dienelactone hydrolase
MPWQNGIDGRLLSATSGGAHPKWTSDEQQRRAPVRRRPWLRWNGGSGIAVNHLRVIFAASVVTVYLALVHAHAEELNSSVPVTVRDPIGAAHHAEMPITVFRPATTGPYAAVVLSHGRPDAAHRRNMGRVKLSSVSATLMGMGLVVVVPTRIGYGMASGPDPESSSSCEHPRYREALAVVADQISAAVSYTRGLPYVDPDRVFLIGHSVGGAGTIAAAVRDLPGVRAAIAFNSGHRGRPHQHAGEPCAPDELMSTFATLGQVQSPTPVLWIQTEGDRTFSMGHARKWFEAFVAAGGNGEFRAFPPYREDSHEWFAIRPDQWRDAVRDYLESYLVVAPRTKVDR